MRAIPSAFLAAAALAVAAVPAFAQDEESVPPVTVITNAEFCALVSEDVVACQGILTGMAATNVVPEAFVAFKPVAPSDQPPIVVPEPEPIADGGVGDTQARDDLEITLIEANWRPNLSGVFYKPGKNKKYVSVLVKYEALEDGARYNIIFWDAQDKDGNRYEATVLGPIEPDLTVGELAAGDSVRGWVTYEVPKDVNQLRIIESQVLKPDVAWNIRR